MGFKEWETPKDFYELLHNTYNTTLDAAASHENALCQTYCTLDGTYMRLGKEEDADQVTVKVSDLDGLHFPWEGQVVFCNPPYDHQLKHWVRKASVSKATSVLLLPPSIDTHWYHDYIWDAQNGHPHTGVQMSFLPYRLKFLRNGVPGKAPRAGNLVVAFHVNAY